MKSFVKIIFIYTILLGLVGLVYSFFISMLMLLFSLLDWVVSPTGMIGGGAQSAISLAIRTAVLCLLIWGGIKICPKIFGSGIKELTKKSMKGIANGPKKLLSSAGDTMRGAMRANPSQLRGLGRATSRLGGKPGKGLGKALNMLSDSKELGSNAKELVGQGKKAGKKDIESDAKDIKLGDTSEQKKAAKRLRKEDKRRAKQQGITPEEARERRLAESRDKSDADTTDVVQAKSEKDNAEEIKGMFDESHKSELEADSKNNVPGAKDMSNSMSQVKNLNETKNNYLNGSGSQNEPITRAGSDDKNNIVASASDSDSLKVDPGAANAASKKMSEDLSELSKAAPGMPTGSRATEDGGVNASGINRGDDGYALPSFADDDIQQAGETFSRNGAVHGTVLPREVTDTGDYSAGNIETYTLPNVESYSDGMNYPNVPVEASLAGDTQGMSQVQMQESLNEILNSGAMSNYQTPEMATVEAPIQASPSEMVDHSRAEQFVPDTSYDAQASRGVETHGADIDSASRVMQDMSNPAAMAGLGAILAGAMNNSAQSAGYHQQDITLSNDTISQIGDVMRQNATAASSQNSNADDRSTWSPEMNRGFERAVRNMESDASASGYEGAALEDMSVDFQNALKAAMRRAQAEMEEQESRKWRDGQKESGNSGKL